MSGIRSPGQRGLGGRICGGVAASSSPAAGSIWDPSSRAVSCPSHGQASSLSCPAAWDMDLQRFAQRCKCFTLPLVTVESKALLKWLKLMDLEGGHRHWSCCKDITLGVILCIFFFQSLPQLEMLKKNPNPKLHHFLFKLL